MKPNIDIPGLAKFIAKEMFVFNKINVIDEFDELGTFNNFCSDDWIELCKLISLEIRKYKLIKLNNENEL